MRTTVNIAVVVRNGVVIFIGVDVMINLETEYIEGVDLRFYDIFQ